MTAQPPTVTYTDELQADKSVRRSYSDGRFEWRQRMPDGRVSWQDNLGNTGTDEMLNNQVIKRTFANGSAMYGREQGYGRTAWSSPHQHIVTVNQSSFGGRVGAILAGIGVGALMGGIAWPPDQLSPAEEEALRQQRHSGSNGGGGDGGDGGGGGDDWGDSGDGGGASDFG